jgi:hypothetical protein
MRRTRRDIVSILPSRFKFYKTGLVRLDLPVIGREEVRRHRACSV